MNERAKTSDTPGANWRLKLGIGLFMLSIALPLGGVPVVTALSLSTTKTATISGVLLVGAEILGILAISVMGKDGYGFLKQHIYRFFKPFAPPRTVSRIRYNLGLVMFIVPILFGWIAIYTADFIPYFSNNQLTFAIGGDALFLASLFVLGGDFWDKIRGLFIYDAKMDFSHSSN
jgi:hypothetical protein